MFKLKGRREGELVVETSLPHSIFSRRKKILLNWPAYSVRVFIDVRRCFKSQSFRHTQNNCNSNILFCAVRSQSPQIPTRENPQRTRRKQEEKGAAKLAWVVNHILADATS
ncbi:hypothetical protein AVEN_101362-1 [Araneus ventricosus]|uniref:Uncharacterized protein n=1 Tax=Araneus ventricosus TaxID=182803 RepID=A0A4Y2SKM1_ARAVE|nr:hypothetical protein AVEN_101362-1 [Araneus ventricosus]